MRRLLDDYNQLMPVGSQEPGLVERTALGAVLQSFYHGVESVFQTVAKRVDGDMPRTADWHRQLLHQMARPTHVRAAVIGPDLQERLEPYLGFRHLARHTYPFLLDWRRMCHLVEDLGNVLDLFGARIEDFVNSMPRQEEDDSGFPSATLE